MVGDVRKAIFCRLSTTCGCFPQFCETHPTFRRFAILQLYVQSCFVLRRKPVPAGSSLHRPLAKKQASRLVIWLGRSFNTLDVQRGQTLDDLAMNIAARSRFTRPCWKASGTWPSNFAIWATDTNPIMPRPLNETANRAVLGRFFFLAQQFAFPLTIFALG